MAGDLGIRERVVILPDTRARAAAPAIDSSTQRRVVHMYGSRVVVYEDGGDARGLPAERDAPAASLQSLSQEEQLGYNAYQLRESGEYLAAKAARPRDGESWDAGDGMSCMQDHGADTGAAARAGAPTSQRLTGSIAVGIVIVEGPTAALKFSAAERTKVVAEVQNGLGWLATQNPEGLVFKYDIKVVTLNVQPGPGTLTSAEKEERWRNPAMQQLGFAGSMAGVSAYVEQLRTNLGTTWTYCAFFTKYPLGHFAYASIGGPRLVMDYANDGWGPDNIDRVFAHETGHIFGAPDEYASSGCSCGGSWGFYGRPNANCANCAPNGGVDCLMKGNTWNMCVHTPFHLGLPLVQQTYTGVWRQGSDAHYLWVNASWNSFQSKWQQLAQQNLRLVDLKITRESGVERFHGVWRQGTGGHYLWVNASQSSFVSKWQELGAQGLRLVDLEVQNVNGSLLYSGVWLPGSDGYYLWINADWNSFQSKWQQLAQQNLRLVDLKIVNVGNQFRYFGVWRQGTGGHYLWVNADWNNFVAKWQELAGQGLRLVDIEVTQTPQGQRFSGVWLPGSDSYYLWANADWQHFLAKWQELAAQGMRLVDLDVVPASGAQSPTPADGGAAEFGGLAISESAAADDDGMGGGGEATGEGGLGFGMGSISGDVEPAAPGEAAGGVPGDGGGSLEALFGGAFDGPGASNDSLDGGGIGGGITGSEQADEPELAAAGIGGGSLR